MGFVYQLNLKLKIPAKVYLLYLITKISQRIIKDSLFLILVWFAWLFALIFFL